MKKIMISMIAILLAIACVVGMGFSSNVIKSKASSINSKDIVTRGGEEDEEKEINKTKNNVNYVQFNSKTDATETYKEYIDKFRKEDVEISIFSLDILYKELDSYDNIDESIREQILAKASDDVIIQFLKEEALEFFKINDLSEQSCSFGLSDENNIINKNEYIKNIESKYYKKGEDSYKKLMVLTNKYGGKSEITIIDEAERDSNVRTKYELIDVNEDEGQYKDYGSRKFTYKQNFSGSVLQATFGYTIGGGCLTTRYITGECTNYCAPITSRASLVGKNIIDKKANNIGEKIIAEAIFKIELPTEKGSVSLGKTKFVMSVEQGKEIQHTSQTGMKIFQRTHVYSKLGD